MIYQTVNESDFIRAFDEAGRTANFSVQARKELFEYYSEMSDVDCDFELDVIAICCDWGEYAPEDLISAFGHLVERLEYTDDIDYFRALLCELGDRGQILRVKHPVEDDTFLFSE